MPAPSEHARAGAGSGAGAGARGRDTDSLQMEQYPFLGGHDLHDESDDESEEQDYLEKPADSARFASCRAVLLFLLAVVSLFGLAGLALSIHPASPSPAPSPAAKPHADHDDHEQQPQAEDGKASSSGHIKYDSQLTASPQLRDAAEYILSPDWDLHAQPVTREYNWTVVDATLNPDGVFRPMMLIDNQYPGPLVECNEGDAIVVHVHNRMNVSTSLHFHGLYQNGTNSMDGTVGITNCPIGPGSSFTYRFTVRDQSGTYWYHAHHSAQASDGLLGPMVVHSKDERTLQQLDYASDRIIMLQDHYHNRTSDILLEYLAPDQENEEPVPDNALINGRGARDCSDFAGWPCDSSNASIPSLDLVPGKYHRLRVINVGAFAEFSVEFDEHPFYVTEVDGTDVVPEPFHRLNINPAQRYSVVIETNATDATAFWMRARMATHCFKRTNKYLDAEIKAAIRYETPGGKGVSQDRPASNEWSAVVEVLCRDLNTSALHPVVARTPPPADDFITLRASFQIGDWRLSRGFFNDSTFHGNATSPSLHRFLDAPDKAQTGGLEKPLEINDKAFEPAKELVLQTRGLRTVDISINNFDDGAHPFHLHGHHFYVLTQVKGGYPPTQAELPAYLESRGLLKNPLRRDTVTVEGFGWAIIRVVFDNPGLWAFHCHNTWHAESGMLMQMLVRSEVVSGWEVDKEERAMCKRKGVATGLRPDDSIWFGQFRKRGE